jgi:hypothetical protein
MRKETREILSPHGDLKAVVRERHDGLFEVELERWTEGFNPYTNEHYSYWLPLGSPSITDHYENAIRTAEERLALAVRTNTQDP